MEARDKVESISHRKLTKNELIIRFIFVTIGSIIMAIALELFLIPNQLLDGGITGIAIILSHLLGFKVGWILFILNLPFIYIGYRQMGKTFALTTLYGIIILSVSSIFLARIPILTKDVFLIIVFGGILVGVGVGLVIRYGGSLDGAEVLAILLSSKFPFTIGEFNMVFNFIIFSAAGFIFGWEQAMYSIIAYFIASRSMDIVVQGINGSKSIWIISSEAEKIGDAILARLGRSVTYLNGEGALIGDRKTVIFCVITRLEQSKLKLILDEFDKNAFLAIGNISEVHGGRFKKKQIH